MRYPLVQSKFASESISFTGRDPLGEVRPSNTAARRMRPAGHLLAGLCTALLCTRSAELFAQQSATISGTVTDQTATALPGVRLTATEVDAGRQFVAMTNEAGEYALLQVPPGRYSLRAELNQF